MTRIFDTIALIGKPRNPDALQTHMSLYQWLVAQNYTVLLDHRLSDDLEKLLGDFPDLGLQIFLSQGAFVKERHLEGDGCLYFDGCLLVVKEAVDGQPEEMEKVT